MVSPPNSASKAWGADRYRQLTRPRVRGDTLARISRPCGDVLVERARWQS